MSTVPIPDRDRWLSGPTGPMGSEIEVGLARHAADRRPGYAPAALVLAVQKLLADEGITTNPGPNELHVAAIGMADVLRALGVRPEVAP